MMWFPIVYTLIIIPITLARLSQFAGAHVPFWATVVTDMIFNLTGFANVLLLAATRKLLPDASALPDFSTARQNMRKSLWKANGITPFTLERSETADKFRIERLARVESASAQSSRRSSLEFAVPAQ